MQYTFSTEFFTIINLSFSLGLRGHSITKCTRWGGRGSKNVCFCPDSRLTQKNWTKMYAFFSTYGRNGIVPWHFSKFSVWSLEVVEVEWHFRLNFDQFFSKHLCQLWKFGCLPQKGKVDLFMTNSSNVLIYFTLLHVLLHYLQGTFDLERPNWEFKENVMGHPISTIDHGLNLVQTHKCSLLVVPHGTLQIYSRWFLHFLIVSGFPL